MNNVLGFGVKAICDYGGWSLRNDTNTITRYLVGPFDDAMNTDQDAMNPRRSTAFALARAIHRH